MSLSVFLLTRRGEACHFCCTVYKSVGVATIIVHSQACSLLCHDDLYCMQSACLSVSLSVTCPASFFICLYMLHMLVAVSRRIRGGRRISILCLVPHSSVVLSWHRVLTGCSPARIGSQAHICMHRHRPPVFCVLVSFAAKLVLYAG